MSESVESQRPGIVTVENEHGVVEIVQRDQDGNIKEREVVDNMVVDAGLNWVASRRNSNSSAVMSHMAIGTGTVGPAAGDTALGAESVRVALSSNTLNGANVVYSATFGAGVGTGAITEAGVFNAASAGTMECRITFAVKNKGASDSLTFTWTRSSTR